MAQAPATSYGIVILVTVGSRLDTVHLERKKDAGAFAEVATFTGGTQNYTDVLSPTTSTYSYQAKVTRAGYTDSAYSGTLGPQSPYKLGLA